jgi:hypothetical protein
MSITDEQPASTRPNNHWGQHSLWTLLVMVAR